MAKVAKKPAPAVEKKSVVTKVIAKTKPAQNKVAKKAVKAEMGISGKYAGIKTPAPKKVRATLLHLHQVI